MKILLKGKHKIIGQPTFGTSLKSGRAKFLPTRTIDREKLLQVTRMANSKTHFVIVDAIGATKSKKTNSRPLKRKPTVALKDLLGAIIMGVEDEDLFLSLSNRLIRLEKPQLAPDYIWNAYAAIEDVKSKQPKNELTALVSLIRRACGIDSELKAFDKTIDENFKTWIFKQNAGQRIVLLKNKWNGCV